MDKLKKELSDNFESRIMPLKRRLDSIIPRDPNLELLHKMLDDALNLSNEIFIDIYMYHYSMHHYNNKELFLGHYYTDYASTKLNMVWERVVNFLGLVYGVEFDDISENNTLSNIYRKLRESPNFTDPVKLLLEKLRSDNSYGQIKNERNSNEHDLSVHLADNLKKEKLNDKFKYEYNEYGFPVLNEESYNDFVDKANYAVRKNKNKTIKELEKGIDIFFEVYIECLNIFKLELIDKKQTIIIKNSEIYHYEYEEKATQHLTLLCENNENLFMKISGLLDKSLEIRDRVKNIADTINMNPILVFKRPPTIQILEYNIDIVYRLVEYIRSLIIEMALINKQENQMIDPNITSGVYYHNCVLLRVYSLFEKIAKLLYTRFELNDYQGNKKDLKNVYLQKVICLAKKEKLDRIKPMKLFSLIVSSDDYKMYEQIRNKAYHGIRPEFILKENYSEFRLFTISIIINILEQLIILLDIIEDGEENALTMAKVIRSLEFKNSN